MEMGLFVFVKLIQFVAFFLDKQLKMQHNEITLQELVCVHNFSPF